MNQPSMLKIVKLMSQQLESLDYYKEQHYRLVNIIDDDETLQKEQQILDDHDDEVATLAIRIQDLIAAFSHIPSSTAHKTVVRKLTHFRTTLASISEAIDELSGESKDVCHLQQLLEQLYDLKTELGEVHNTLLAMELDASAEVHI